MQVLSDHCLGKTTLAVHVAGSIMSWEALTIHSLKHHLSVLTMCWAASRQAGCGCRAGRARRGRGAAPPLHDSWPPGDRATLGFQVCCLLLLPASPASLSFLLYPAAVLLLLLSWHYDGDRLCLSCFLLLLAPCCFLLPAAASFLLLSRHCNGNKSHCRQAILQACMHQVCCMADLRSPVISHACMTVYC